MAFTNVWDDTFPPDTQLANLLGQDLRNFRLDTQQRMAAISGLDANKPTFSADAQPANWNGVLFFATDTGLVYQFNNPSWTNVTSDFILKSTALKSTSNTAITGAATNTVVASFTIPGNTMGANGHLRITTSLVSNASPLTLNLSFGGVTVPLGMSLLNPSNVFAEFEIFNLNATNSQRYSNYWTGASSGAGNFVGSGSIDTTTTQTLQVLATQPSGTTNIQPVMVELL